jgi:hypothetical protein
MSNDVHVTFGGDTSELEAAAAEAKALVRNLQKEITALTKEWMTNKGDPAIKAQLLEVSGALMHAKQHMSELTQEQRELYRGAKEAGEGFGEVKEGLLKIAELAGLAFSADKVKEWALGMVEAAENIKNTSLRMGESVENVQKLQALAKTSGVDFGTLEMSMERLAFNLQKANREGSPVAKTLAAIHVNYQEFIRENPAEQIETLSQAFSHFADTNTKTAAVMNLFGRGGAQMLPVLHKTKEELEELDQTLKKSGAIMSNETVKEFQETKESVNKLDIEIQGLGVNIMEKLNPALKWTTDQLAAGAEGWNMYFQAMHQGLDNPVGVLLGEKPKFLYGKLTNPFGASSEKPNSKTSATEGDTRSALPEINLDGGKSVRDAVQTAEQIAQTQIKAAQNAYAQQDEIIRESARLGTETQEQALYDRLAILAQEKNAVEAAFDQELRTAGLTKDQRIKIEKEKMDEIAKINLSMKKTVDDYAIAIQTEYEKTADAITKPFESQFRGLLEGTENWGRATKKILEDVVISMMEKSTEMTAHWISDEAARTMASQVAAGQRQNANIASDTASLLSNSGAILKAIANDAALVFSNVFAYLSPVLGPLAAAPATAAMGAVSAMGGKIASADIGMWQVPQDQLSLVHHNELIMPAAQASAFRDMLTNASNGGGGTGGNVHVNPSVNLHVSALDGASVASFFNNNGHNLTNAINLAVASGAHLGLRRSHFT